MGRIDNLPLDYGLQNGEVWKVVMMENQVS